MNDKCVQKEGLGVRGEDYFVKIYQCVSVLLQPTESNRKLSRATSRGDAWVGRIG